jgi:site-specific DNA recombinase
MGRFDEVLRSAPPEQRKTLLHLVVKRITVNAQHKIDSVELNFNESVQKHFFELGPSAEKAEGSFRCAGNAPVRRFSLAI